MAESDSVKSLSKDYLLKEVEEKLDLGSKPADEAVKATPEVSVAEKPVEAAVTAVTGESAPVTSDSDAVTEAPPATNEESSESADQENADDETSGIKLETAPGDYRFPTTNQSRHCFTRYVEYHRCVAAKGDGAPECDKFAKYYRSLCPGEWIDRWNEQRENGTFPGPL